MEGDKVTLHCRNKTNSTNLPAAFYTPASYKPSSSGKMVIKDVSKSHEGLYSCSIPGVGESPRGWLTVRVLEKQKKRLVHHRPPHVLVLLWIAVTVFLAAVMLLLLLGFTHIKRQRGTDSIIVGK
ncbi:carcinoembryonic antigen-related cell adhesion molecule 20-like [Centropristis striata]|uniref:carcinoembryonic antigen-related cell adhesion molecule 20-like n=1 Tax=Centropristis striata TaxID=184440 RepID=UPI0027E0A049|nr:carcinoembryonic antigen-related cell adhesion molecule 20-like [Centropristis striata]